MGVLKYIFTRYNPSLPWLGQTQKKPGGAFVIARRSGREGIAFSFLGVAYHKLIIVFFLFKKSICIKKKPVGAFSFYILFLFFLQSSIVYSLSCEEKFLFLFFKAFSFYSSNHACLNQITQIVTPICLILTPCFVSFT